MADEGDENQPKIKKEKERNILPGLAPGDVVQPVEFNMFERQNMTRTLNIPGKRAYHFFRELAPTIDKRMEGIRQRLRADEVDPSADFDTMDPVAGLQSWEAVEPKSGHLKEYLDTQERRRREMEPKKTQVADAAASKEPTVTPSVIALMRASLPKPKQEDKYAMPAANRRSLAPRPPFDPLIKAQEKPEFGDYYETIEKWDKEWKDNIGKRPSEMRPDDKLEPKGKGDAKDSKKKASSVIQPVKVGHARMSVRVAAEKPIVQIPVAAPVVKKAKPVKKPPGTPAFLDELIEHFLTNVTLDGDLEAWLTPVNITPVFKIRDLPPDIEKCVVTVARTCHSKFIDDQKTASFIRSALEKHHGYAVKWHVVVGRKFGLQVNADKGNFLFMYIGHLGYVVFRSFG